MSDALFPADPPAGQRLSQDALGHILAAHRLWLMSGGAEGECLSEASLIGACLERSSLWSARLHRAQLAYADLTEAKLAGASLWGAQMYGAEMLRTEGLTAEQLAAVSDGGGTRAPMARAP